MIRDILMILSGIVGGSLFIVIRNTIVKRLENKVLQSGQQGLIKEPFSLLKFISGMTTLKSGTAWAKDIHDILNLRKLIIIGVILSAIYGYAYWRGTINKPIHLSPINSEMEFTIPVPGGKLALHKAKDSDVIQWIDVDTGKVISTVKIKDISQLKNALKPYGFILKPIFVVGAGIGEPNAITNKLNAMGEVGIGAQWFKWYKWYTDVALTTGGFYPLGISYQITPNSFAGLSAGIGYKGDKRILFKWSWRF